MACKDCSYYNENDRSGSSGYCSYYRRYYEPDDNCSHCTYGGSNNCEDCQYCDVNDKSGSKAYCTYYKQYVYTSDSCSRFSPKSSSGGCFLTSACCGFRGLADNCEELTVLRSFRDNYMKSFPEGKRLVDEYYEVAPRIVEEINLSAHTKEAYEGIYATVLDCVSLIKHGQNEDTLERYKSMTLELKKKYLNKEENR